MKYFKLLIISVFFLSVSAVSFAQSDSAVKNIEPEVLNTVLNNATVQLVDVRTPNEFKSGHIDKVFFYLILNWDNYFIKMAIS